MSDLPRLIELLAQLSLDDQRESGLAANQKAYEAAFLAIDADLRQTLLVAEADGRVVGTVAVIVVPNLSYKGRPYAIVENMVVDAEARGHRHGEALIERALAIARDAGCYKVSLTSNRRRADAHRFYERLGFRYTHAGFRHDF